MNWDDTERATGVVTEVGLKFARFEYIDAMVPALLGKTKLIKLEELPEDKRKLNAIITVQFSCVPLDRSKYTPSQLLFNHANERGISSIS